MTAGEAMRATANRLRLTEHMAAVGAGIVDVGSASAATFVCGLLAVHLLQPQVLGAYALAFRILVLAMAVPASLIFYPREVQAMQLPEPARVRVLAPALRIGVPVGILAAGLASVWPLTFPGGVSRADIVALNVTMCAVIVLSPCQDHLRRTLHMSGRSWLAAKVSLGQLLVVSIGALLVLLGLVRAPDAWVPLGLLAVANATSLAAGLLQARSTPPAAGPTLPRADASLLRSGSWLLVMGMSPYGAAVLAGLFLAQVKGPEALGYLEAARIVAQPILVFAAGLNAVLGPRSMHAAVVGDATRARRLSRRFAAVVLSVGIVYGAAFGIPHALNLFARLSPAAFETPWVVMLMIIAHTAMSLALPERSELLGANKSRSLASIETVASLASLLCAFLAPTIGIIALPLGLIVQAIIRRALMRNHAMRLYEAAAGQPAVRGS